MRALATIDRITELRRHPDADRLDLAMVRGWTCVVERGEFTEGEAVVFIEPDAFLYKEEPRFRFLMKRGVRIGPDGKRGHVLKTARLRGVVSQGLVMKFSEWPELHTIATVNADVTEHMPLRLWEPVLPATMDICGPFPPGIPKTDEDRLQNVADERLAALSERPLIVVTVKLDGASTTLWTSGPDGELRVAGRNWELSPDSGAYQIAAQSEAGRYMVEERMIGYYVQGELVGPGVQGNRGRLPAPDVRLFTFGVRDGGPVLSPEAWPRELVECAVPVLERPGGWRGLDRAAWQHVADGLGTDVEGVVVRGYDLVGTQTESFKVVNREYLLATGS